MFGCHRGPLLPQINEKLVMLRPYMNSQPQNFWFASHPVISHNVNAHGFPEAHFLRISPPKLMINRTVLSVFRFGPYTNRGHAVLASGPRTVAPLAGLAGDGDAAPLPSSIYL